MVPYITRLESHFTKYTLGMIANMSSSHAIRIYELLIQWGGIGRREMEIAWLRNLLRLENQYTSINDFKKYVVDISVLQINKFTDLSVSYTQKKTGRSVTHLIFTFSQKPNTKQTVPTQSGNAVAKPSKQPPLPAATQEVDEKEDSESPFRFAKAAITPKTQCEYLKLRTAEEIELCIERANEYGGEQEKAGKPVRYGAVYRKAIVEGWHEEKARQKAQQAEDAARKEASKQAAEKARRTEAEKKELGKMETELSAAWFSALPEDDKHALGVAYVAESNRIDVENFKHKGYTYIGFQLFIKKKWLESKQASVTKGASHEPARANT